MARTSKLSSVKRLILIGAVQDVPENYHNVKAILDQLNIEALDFTVSADIKMCKFYSCECCEQINHNKSSLWTHIRL